MVQKWKLVWLIVFAVSLIGLTRADEISDLRKEQEKMYNQFMEMNNRLMRLEAAQRDQGQKITKMEETGGFEIPETLAWLERVKIYGDFRYRYECRDRDWRSDPKDDRHRIRARVGMKFQINDEFMFDFRLATDQFLSDSSDALAGGGAAGSRNQTIGDYWSAKSIWLDRAYAAWTPNWAEGLTLLFGKTFNPYFKPGGSDLIWDGDVNPEGIGVQYVMSLSEMDELFFNGYTGYVEENGSSADIRMLGGQVGLAHTFDDASKLTAGVSYFDYANIKGGDLPVIGGIVIDGGAEGNTNDGSSYTYDYDLFEAFGQYDMKICDLPVSIFGDYVLNTASGVKDDTGWLAGFSVNKTKKVGDWAFAYNYRDLEADAVVGAFADGDAGGGGTDVRGHEFSLNYMLAKNTTVGATYYCQKNLKETSDQDFRMIQLDLVVKF